MNNDNVIDDRIVASLRSLRPDRWNRWIEAGKRGQEQAKVLGLLIKASKDLPYFERLSHFVQACLEISGVSTEQANQVLGIDLNDSCRAMDEVSCSTVEAAELLQLDREYLKLALLLNTCTGNEINLQEANRRPAVTDLLDGHTEEQLQISHPKSNSRLNKHESDLDKLAKLFASRTQDANPEVRDKLRESTQKIDAWLNP